MTIHKPARNALYLLAAYIWTFLAGLVSTRIIAGYMGPDQYGSYILAISFTTMFAPITHFGVDKILIREIASQSNITGIKTTIRNGAILRTIMSSVALLTCVSFAIIANLQHDPWMFGVALANMITVALDSLANAILQSRQEMQHQGLASLLTATLRLILLTILVIVKADVVFIAATIFIAPMPGLVWKLASINRLGLLPSVFHDIDFESVKNMFIAGIPLGFGVLLGTIQTRIDVSILSKMVSIQDVGTYGAAYKIIDLIYFLPNILSVVSFPVVAQIGIKANKTVYKERHDRLFLYSLLIGLPLCFSVIGLSREVILLVYGSAYSGAVDVLKILSLAVLFQFFTPLFANLLISKGFQKSTVIIGIIGVAVNFILNLILIPLYGIVASAIATLVTNIVVAALGIIYVKYYIGFFCVPLSDCIKPLLAGLSMFVVMLLLWSFTPPIFATVMGLFTYLLLLLVIKGKWYYEIQTFFIRPN